jgi:DNA-binding response OmpR family regulator
MLSLPLRAGTALHLVLIAEDDSLIAMDLEDTLSHEGFYIVGPALSVAAALQLLEQTDPDAAVLDMNLNGELITPVAELLSERAIPSCWQADQTMRNRM